MWATLTVATEMQSSGVTTKVIPAGAHVRIVDRIGKAAPNLVRVRIDEPASDRYYDTWVLEHRHIRDVRDRKYEPGECVPACSECDRALDSYDKQDCPSCGARGIVPTGLIYGLTHEGETVEMRDGAD